MEEEDKSITTLGETNFRDQRKRFGIKVDDRRRHMYLIGKTGMGKTTMMENMVISDIQSGKGLCVVDPHGDFANKMLDYVPSDRINDVVYFDPGDVDFPIAFNIMENVDPRYKHLIASGLVGVFKKIWAESWGPRLEYVLRNAILALLDYPGSTLLGIMRMLVDKTFRKKVITKISDPVVKSFWVDEYSKYPDRFQAEAIAPIQNKVGQFLSISLIRNIVGQTKSTIDIREIMDKNKIILLNLAKGKIGEDAAALFGAIVITKVQLAAMSRADINEEDRKDFYLYVDEFQNFATESFADILSEARKYRLNLIMAHQYIAQLSEPVRDAVFGNVGTMVSFRIGATDAEFLAQEFAPVFDETDLVNLPKYNIYLKLMIDGVASNAFSAQTIVDNHPKHSLRDKVISVSRERYAKKREVVEDKIARWSGMFDEAQEQERTAQEARQQRGGRDNRYQSNNRNNSFSDNRNRNNNYQDNRNQDNRSRYQRPPQQKQSVRPSQTKNLLPGDTFEMQKGVVLKKEDNNSNQQKPISLTEAIKNEEEKRKIKEAMIRKHDEIRRDEQKRYKRFKEQQNNQKKSDSGKKVNFDK
ncbi:MAG: type IV secretion system DNA-binding domain-containing protein [bacterium]